MQPVSKAGTLSLSTWPSGCVVCTGALRWEASKQQQKWWWSQHQESTGGTAFKWTAQDLDGRLFASRPHLQVFAMINSGAEHWDRHTADAHPVNFVSKLL